MRCGKPETLQIRVDVSMQIKLPALDQLKRRGRGNGLRHRGQAKNSALGIDRSFGVELGEAKSTCHGNRAF